MGRTSGHFPAAPTKPYREPAPLCPAFTPRIAASPHRLAIHRASCLPRGRTKSRWAALLFWKVLPKDSSEGSLSLDLHAFRLSYRTTPVKISNVEYEPPQAVEVPPFMEAFAKELRGGCLCRMPRASILRVGSVLRHGFSPFAPEMSHSRVFSGTHQTGAGYPIASKPFTSNH